MDSDDECNFFEDDIYFTQESVEKRLGINKKYNNKRKRIIDKYEKEKNIINTNEKDNKEKKDKNNKSKLLNNDKIESEDKKLTNKNILEPIVVDDDELIEENKTIKLNIKVYKRKGSEIVIVKTLIVALYIKDPILKLITYISKNINPRPSNLNEIKIYFDGDLIENNKIIKEIGIEDEEQLDIKIPFDSNWNK